MLKFKKEHIPNYISVFRIILIPLYVLSFFEIIPWGVNPMISSGVVFVLAGISDLLDGFLARRNHWITDLGKLLDPFADKMMELAVTISFAIRFGGAFLALAVITIIKEAIMIVGAFVIMKRGKFTVSSVWYGKGATVAWFALVFFVSFFPFVHENIVLCNILCCVLIAIMLFAFTMYVIHFREAIKRTANEVFHRKHETLPDGEAEEIK